VRAHTLKVAGPAALLVAKQYKIFERLAQSARQRPRDSHDVYRLLREVEPEVFFAASSLCSATRSAPLSLAMRSGISRL
jgi:hypothetical protein